MSEKYDRLNPSRQQSVLYCLVWIALDYVINLKCDLKTWFLFIVASAVSFALWHVEMKAKARELQLVTGRLEMLKKDIDFLIGYAPSLKEMLCLSNQHREDFLLRKSFNHEEWLRVEITGLTMGPLKVSVGINAAD